MSLFSTLQHLLPRGRAWRMVADRTLRKYLVGLGAFADEVRGFIDDVRDDIDPRLTRARRAWEQEFGLGSAGTLGQRTNRLVATWADGGGQDPAHMQETVTAAGFDACLHEWWTTPNSPRTAYDPRDVTRQPLAGTVQCASFSEQPQCLDTASATTAWPQPQCNDFLANEPGYLVNVLDPSDVPPDVPSDSTKWHQFLYWSGSRYVREVPALIESVLRNEFERLVLKMKPAQSWVVANVEYVDEPEFFSEDGAVRWSALGLPVGDLEEWLAEGEGITLVADPAAPSVEADIFEEIPGVRASTSEGLSTSDVRAWPAIESGTWSVVLVIKPIDVTVGGNMELASFYGPNAGLYPRVNINLFSSIQPDALRVQIFDSDANLSKLDSPNNIGVLDGRAHCIVVTYDAGDAEIFLDGTSVASGTITDRDVSGINRMRLGESGDDFGYYGEVAIVPHVLDADEISVLQSFVDSLYRTAVDAADPLERWLSADLAKGSLVSWEGERGVSTIAPDTLGEYPHVETKAFGTLPAVVFESADELADTSVATSIADAVGSSFSAAWFGLFEAGASGAVLGAAVADGAPDVHLDVDASAGSVSLTRPTGGPLSVTGLWDLLEADTPHAFVVTYDRATDTLSVVVDGQVIGEDTAGSASDLAGVTCLYVGGGAAFKASDVVLFDGALSQTTAVAVSNAMARSNGACSLALVEDLMSVLEYKQIKAVSARPPRQGETYRVAVTTSSDVVYLPGAGVATLSTFDTHFVTLRAVGADVQVQFGVVGDTLSLTDDQASAVAGSPDVLTPNDATGVTIKDGEERAFYLSGENQLAFIGKGAGFLELWRSSHDADAP